MCKLQIETLKFVLSSCCFTISELVLSDQLNPDTNIFWTNLFRPTKFRANQSPNHLKFGKITKLLVLIWSGVRCFTVRLQVISEFIRSCWTYATSCLVSFVRSSEQRRTFTIIDLSEPVYYHGFCISEQFPHYLHSIMNYESSK